MNSIAQLAAECFGLLAASVNLIGFVFYFRSMRGSGSTSSIGWLLSTLIALLAAVSQLGVSTPSSSASYFIGAGCCVIAFAFSFRDSSPISLSDKTTIILVLFIAYLSIISPAWSIYCMSVYYLLSYSFFFRAIHAGKREPALPWFIWSTGSIFQLLSVSISSPLPQAYILPLTNLACWSGIAIVAQRNNQLQRAF